MVRASFRGAVIAVAIVALGIACTSRPPQAEKRELRVGVILPLTGSLAEMGSYERQAMELAAQQASAIHLIFEDSRSMPATAVSAAKKLISVDKVSVLVTSTTGASLAVQPVAEANGLPLVAFCMDPTITDGHPSTVRFYIGVEEEAHEILAFLGALPVSERVGILHAAVPVWRKIVQSTYAPALADHFGSAPLVEEYNLPDRDFRSILGKVTQAKVTTLVILGYGFEYPPLFQQMRDLGIRQRLSRITGGWGFLYSSLTPADLEGIVVAGPRYVFERTSEAATFATQFQTATGRSANFDAAFAFELVRTLPALNASGSLSPGTIRAGVVALGKRSGVVGEYSFSQRGDMIVQTGLGEYRSGILSPFRR